ncbi:MAG: helical backbone metal receptor, partial [Stackebrandtia sp.]
MPVSDATPHDDLGEPYLGGPPRRVVSLVPSTTETVALAAPELLVGATDYCVRPDDLDVPRVGGSKYPSLEKVLACRPDLVLANAEENRKSDVEALREAGVAVWTSFPRDVSQACASARRMLVDGLGLAEPDWISHAERAWAAPSPPARRAVIPIWRRPWMVLG